MIVVDSNVLVYLVAGSEHFEAAAAVLGADPEWAAPGLALSEVRNVLVGLCRRRHLEPPDAREMLYDVEAVVEGRVAEVDGEEVLATALDTGLSAYDAEFVVLARALGVPLVTADRQILAAAPDVATALDTLSD